MWNTDASLSVQQTGNFAHISRAFPCQALVTASGTRWCAPIGQSGIFFSNIVIFFRFFSFCPVSIHGSERGRLSNSHPGPPRGKISKSYPVPAHSVVKCQNSTPARPMAIFWACPVVPLSKDNAGTSVPLSWKFALFRPVGKHWYLQTAQVILSDKVIL